MTALVAAWHSAACAAVGTTPGPSFVARLHGRDLTVERLAEGRWHWAVVAPHGGHLAEGDAPSRLAAERAAEDEATAVHPPTADLLDRLLA